MIITRNLMIMRRVRRRFHNTVVNLYAAKMSKYFTYWIKDGQVNRPVGFVKYYASWKR